ncbi:MAG: hypothetical protein RL103_1473, partial [Pseudomonadota bacterium]
MARPSSQVRYLEFVRPCCCPQVL